MAHKGVSTAAATVIAILICLLPVTGNAYYLRLLTTMGMYVALGMGLNVMIGLSGLLDMGYMGFFAVGAYTRALLASPQLGIHLPFGVALCIAVAAGLLLSLAVGIPTLRLRGDYLAIVTMGFSELIRLMLLNLDRPVNITNGPNGIIRIDPISLMGIRFDSPAANYYLILCLAALAYVAYLRLDGSILGLRLRAVRDDRIAAESLGIDAARYRVLALAIGSVFATISGVFFASWQGAVFPQNFSLGELITLYCMVILGGVGNPKGTLLGVSILAAVPEFLRGYSVYRMLIYGAILVIFMAVRPGGILGAARARLVRRTPRSSANPRTSGAPARSEDPSAPALEVRNISRAYGGLRAVSDLSFSVRRGEVLSIIGPNGAGKTTLLNIISGVTRPTSGDCLIYGENVTRLPPHAIYRKGLSRTFQNLRLFDSLTAEENVLVAVGSRLDVNGLQDIASEAAGSLDYVRRKQLEMRRAMAGDPAILLLDEPAAGVQADEREHLAEQILSLRDAGKAIVLVEHRMDLVMQVSDRVIVLDGGRKIAEGTPAEVAADRVVREVYLGMDEGAEGKRIQIRTPRPQTGDAPLLCLSAVQASYGGVQALKGVDMSVYPGEAVAVLGANGAGKSTLLRVIMGGFGGHKGTIRFSGRNMGFVPEGRRVFSGMTVEENLRLGASSRQGGDCERDLESVYSLFGQLSSRRKQAAGTLSGGEQQMLALGRALMAKPSLLLLDEPSMGLSPVAARTVYDTLAHLRDTGVTILLVEQNAELALGLCDRGYVLRDGCVVAEGTPSQLSFGDNLYSAYMAVDQMRSHS